jgi:hypothetical protein
MPPLAGVAGQALFGALMVSARALRAPELEPAEQDRHRDPRLDPLMPLTVAYLAWFPALRYVPTSLAAVTVLLSPAIGVIWTTRSNRGTSWRLRCGIATATIRDDKRR